MPKRFHSSMILAVVFVLGILGGVAGMVWAWPGIRARYFHHPRPTFTQFLQTSLNLTTAQVPEVQKIYKETGDRSHTIHLQFVPDYTRVCEEYVQIRGKERDAFAPVRQEELDKMHQVLTPTQWATFQKQRTAAMKAQTERQQRQDSCQHAGQGPGGPGPGGPNGGRGRGGHRGGPPPSR